MQTLTATVQTPSHTVSSVNETISKSQTPAGMVVLPKMNKLGQVVVTSIDPNHIKGAEPTTIKFGHKVYSGTKIYTKAGTFFKVFAAVGDVLFAQHGAKAGMLAVVDSANMLPSYQKQVHALKSAPKLALPAGQPPKPF
jgi:uncharacterized cupredoxin-like copper-binding protein